MDPFVNVRDVFLENKKIKDFNQTCRVDKVYKPVQENNTGALTFSTKDFIFLSGANVKVLKYELAK